MLLRYKAFALIRKALREYIPSTTKIIIAQRIASIQDADNIIILDGGKISASGTHEELIRTNEIYQELFYSQNNAESNSVKQRLLKEKEGKA